MCVCVCVHPYTHFTPTILFVQILRQVAANMALGKYTREALDLYICIYMFIYATLTTLCSSYTYISMHI